MSVCFESLLWGDGCPDPLPGAGQKQFLLRFIKHRAGGDEAAAAVGLGPSGSSRCPRTRWLLPHQAPRFEEGDLHCWVLLMQAASVWSCLLRFSPPVCCLWDARERCSVTVTKMSFSGWGEVGLPGWLQMDRLDSLQMQSLVSCVLKGD